jgi:hypothetical protein
MADYPAHGKARSWAAVVVIVTGFTVGGVALILGPTWWLFWTALGIVVVGGIVALFSDILADVVLDDPRDIPETMQYSLFGKEDTEHHRGGQHGERSGKPTARDTAEQPHG